MENKVKEFNAYREKMNDVILSKDNLVLKRLFNLDTQTYSNGALNVKTKEMLGLVASMVLRCDDCIKYHLENATNKVAPLQKFTKFFLLLILLVVQLLFHIREEAQNFGKS